MTNSMDHVLRNERHLSRLKDLVEEWWGVGDGS